MTEGNGIIMLAHGPDIIYIALAGCLFYVFLIAAWIVGFIGLVTVFSSTKANRKPALVMASIAIGLAIGLVAARTRWELSNGFVTNVLIHGVEAFAGEDWVRILTAILPAGIPGVLGGLTLWFYSKNKRPRA